MDSQKLEIPAEVRTFLEGILTDAGMNTLDSEMREEMVRELYARLDNFLTSVIVENLPPENVEEFIKLNEEKGSQEEIEQYLKTRIPNTGGIFQKAFADFRDMYLQNVSVARAAPAPST